MPHVHTRLPVPVRVHARPPACMGAQLKEAIAAFASSLGQGKAAPEVIDAISKALAEKAVVMENGKPVDGQVGGVDTTPRACRALELLRMWGRRDVHVMDACIRQAFGSRSHVVSLSRMHASIARGVPMHLVTRGVLAAVARVAVHQQGRRCQGAGHAPRRGALALPEDVGQEAHGHARAGRGAAQGAGPPAGVQV